MAAFASSYIPTTTATVTRAADVASITGSAFSSWYRQDEGTVFASLNMPQAQSNDADVFKASDGTDNNRIRLYKSATTNVTALQVTASGVSAFATAGAFGTQLQSIAAGYQINNAVCTRNGALGSVQTTAAIPSNINNIFIGQFLGGVASLNGHIRRLTYWPVRLPNPTLEAITQP